MILIWDFYLLQLWFVWVSFCVWPFFWKHFVNRLKRKTCAGVQNFLSAHKLWSFTIRQVDLCLHWTNRAYVVENKNENLHHLKLVLTLFWWNDIHWIELTKQLCSLRRKLAVDPVLKMFMLMFFFAQATTKGVDLEHTDSNFKILIQ